MRKYSTLELRGYTPQTVPFVVENHYGVWRLKEYRDGIASYWYAGRDGFSPVGKEWFPDAFFVFLGVVEKSVNVHSRTGRSLSGAYYVQR